jgi:hypothetical protein
MPSEEKDLLEESLTGYKEKIAPITKTTLIWNKDLIFTGTTQQGYEIEFDAHAQWGCKLTEALLLSLAGCMQLWRVNLPSSALKLLLAAMLNPELIVNAEVCGRIYGSRS